MRACCAEMPRYTPTLARWAQRLSLALALQGIVQDIGRATKRNPMLDVDIDFSASEQLLRCTSILPCQCRCVVQHMVGVSKGIRPQVDGDGAWPATHGMDEHGPCQLSHITDALLSHAILPMRIDSTEGERLSLGANRFPEEIVSEDAIVSMVMLHHDSMGCGVEFEGSLGFYCLDGLGGELQVDIPKAGTVIDEDCGALVALLGGDAPQLSHHARCW